jgi:hypothetical protein
MIHLVVIFLDGVFVFLLFPFHISTIFINLRNKLVIMNLISKEINPVTNWSNGISMVVYKSLNMVDENREKL